MHPDDKADIIAAILTAGLVSSREGNNAENIVDWFEKSQEVPEGRRSR